jgi:hypothetical protein
MRMIKLFPRWGWVVLGGILVILIAALAGDLYLPEECLPRAVCGTAGFGLGLVLLMVTQGLALVHIRTMHKQLGFQEYFLFSPMLWLQVVRQMPATRWLLYLGSWGSTLATASLLLVGGLSYWLNYLPDRQIKDRELQAAVTALEKDPLENHGALLNDLNSSVLGDPTDPANTNRRKVVDKRPTVICVIVGYVTDEDGNPSRLVVGSLRNGKLSYAGTVKKGILPEEADELQKKLAKLVRPEPLIRGLSIPGAIWVKGDLQCEVHQSGFDPQGHLIDPVFKTLTFDL